MYWINIEKIGYISKISDIFDFFVIFDFFEKNHDFFHPWCWLACTCPLFLCRLLTMSAITCCYRRLRLKRKLHRFHRGILVWFLRTATFRF